MDQQPFHNPPESRLHFLDYWRVIRVRKAIIITVFLLTSIIATVVTVLMPKYYSSTVQIEIQPDAAAADIATPMGATSSGDYNPYWIETQFQIMQDPVVLDLVIDKMNLTTIWGKKFSVDQLKKSEAEQILKNNMRLSEVRNTMLIEISYFSTDKKEAADIANAIADAYRAYRFDRFQQQTSRGISVLETNYMVEGERIQMLQSNINDLRDQLHIVDTDPNSLTPTPTLTQEQLQQLHTAMIDHQTRYVALSEQLKNLSSLDRENLRATLPIVDTGTALPGLLENLRATEQQYVKLTNDYSPGNLEIQRVESLLQKLNSQVDSCVEGIMIGLTNNLLTEKAALDAISNQVEMAKEKDQAESIRGQPYWDAKREKANLLDLHKLNQAKIAAEKQNMAIPRFNAVSVTQPAEIAKSPSKPNKVLNITLGVVFGLLIGIGLAFFIEYLDTSVKTIDDVERAFQAPVLGVIPQNVGVLPDEGQDSRYAEAYRVLRTNLLFSRKDDKLNSIVMVSAGAGEGKSTTTLNLATVFAQAGDRIVVVDSDLRRPTLHKLLHVTNDVGLTNYLLKQNTLEEVVQTTNIPNLHFMASGKLPNSSMSILNSSQMKEMISELKRRYDFVLFDSPPILGVSDASVLASEMDLVVQIVQYRRYPQPMSLRAKQVIEKVGGRFLGVVLNNINMSQDESYYYYSGYYYDYYSTNEKQEPSAAGNGNDADRVGIKQKY
ncbi:MAG TPA: polysaccharide biosynthesis tyrosine autokinase [Verrucomicrobiae bacterium]|nr:polysaccharide biosynthesis tyrosine autokinase [Verrucomicrobiae bacterium]